MNIALYVAKSDSTTFDIVLRFKGSVVICGVQDRYLLQISGFRVIPLSGADRCNPSLVSMINWVNVVPVFVLRPTSRKPGAPVGCMDSRKKDFGPLRISIGGSPEKIINNPEQKISTVCRKCNNGWMSDLEAQNIPLIGCLMQDTAAPLDASQQSSLAAWTINTAMVLDSMKGLKKSLFYDRSECVKMRENQTIPDRSRIWIGRSSLNSLGAFGTDLAIVLPDILKVGVGCATTIIVGHLAVQVLATHVVSEHEDKNIGNIPPKPGRWDEMLLPIWPIGNRPVTWPPPVTFTDSGERSIAKLMDRWRIEKAVD
jgi:hypothetical protein